MQPDAVTGPGVRSTAGQVLAPRDFRDRGGTGMRGVRVDALRGDLDVRGFRGSRWLRWLRSLSQARTNPTTAIRVTVMSPGTTAMWLMVVFSDFSRLRGDPPSHLIPDQRRAGRLAASSWCRDRRINPFVVTPALMKITRLGR